MNTTDAYKVSAMLNDDRIQIYCENRQQALQLFETINNMPDAYDVEIFSIKDLIALSQHSIKSLTNDWLDDQVDELNDAFA